MKTHSFFFNHLVHHLLKLHLTKKHKLCTWYWIMNEFVCNVALCFVLVKFLLFVSFIFVSFSFCVHVVAWLPHHVSTTLTVRKHQRNICVSENCIRTGELLIQHYFDKLFEYVIMCFWFIFVKTERNFLRFPLFSFS